MLTSVGRRNAGLASPRHRLHTLMLAMPEVVKNEALMVFFERRACRTSTSSSWIYPDWEASRK